MIPTDPETGPISRSELVKGYEIEKNRYVILEPEELEAVRLETTRALDIERFVDLNSIDRLYWNDPFFLLPEGPEGVDAYIVIREAMRATRRIALGRVVMHTRERLMALEPRDKGIVAYSLRMGDEVLSVEKAFRDIPNARPQRQMIEVAEKIIEQQEGPFEPSKFTDRYESALRDLIRRKERGEKTVAVLPPEPSNVIDLMDALRKSLARKGASTNKQSRARMRQLAARQHKLRSRS